MDVVSLMYWKTKASKNKQTRIAICEIGYSVSKFECVIHSCKMLRVSTDLLEEEKQTNHN